MTGDGGISRLKARLKAIPDAVKAAASVATLKQANAIADTMRRLAPDDPATSAPDLKSSITVTGPGSATPGYSQPGGAMVVPENAVAITAGNSAVRYPHLVEYGTAKAPAQPFFWPAFRLHQRKATAAIKRGVSTAVRKNWGSGP